MSNLDGAMITIKNWEKYNPRKDVKQSSWFRLEQSLFENPDFFHLSHAEVCFWIYLLSNACKKQSKQIRLNQAHAERIGRFRACDIASAVKKLTEIGCVEVADVTSTVRASTGEETDQNGHVRHETNETNETNNVIFDFEPLWKQYPRRVNKTEARERFKRLILCLLDYKALKKAVANYAAYCAKHQTDEPHIRHFASFLGTEGKEGWRDWVEMPTSGNSSTADVFSFSDSTEQDVGHA